MGLEYSKTTCRQDIRVHAYAHSQISKAFKVTQFLGGESYTFSGATDGYQTPMYTDYDRGLFCTLLCGATYLLIPLDPNFLQANVGYSKRIADNRKFNATSYGYLPVASDMHYIQKSVGLAGHFVSIIGVTRQLSNVPHGQQHASNYGSPILYVFQLFYWICHIVHSCD